MIMLRSASMTVHLATGLVFSPSQPSSSLSPSLSALLCRVYARYLYRARHNLLAVPPNTLTQLTNSLVSQPGARRFALRRRCGLHTELAEVGHEQRTGLVAHCAHDVELGPADPYL
jgi:hypothetical protein